MIWNRETLRGLYQRTAAVPPAEVPPADPLQHTMGPAVDLYALQRLPSDMLDLAVRAGMRIELHGIHPDHLPLVKPGARLAHPGHWFGYGKAFNLVRPRLFALPGSSTGGRQLERGDTLIMAVPPGRDYVLHNARILRQYLHQRGYSPQLLGKVVRYPVAEASIADWTGLESFVRPGDRLLMGYVKEVLPHLLAAGGRVVREDVNPYYGAVRVAMPGGLEVCTLGVRFSFWGCISARLAEACTRLGAAEIVYVGKLGTLRSPEDIYSTVFSPTSFLDYGVSPRLLPADEAPPNGVIAEFPHLDSGTHMSVATVLEEDLEQRRLADGYLVQSIDNEISQMARAIAEANAVSGHSTAFSALHFATDYLRRPGEPERTDIFNLTNHRRGTALRHKDHMIAEIAAVLGKYYASGGRQTVMVPPARGTIDAVPDAPEEGDV